MYQVRYFMFSLKYILFQLLNNLNQITAMPLWVHLLVSTGRPSIFLSLWKKVLHRDVCNTIFKINNEEILQHLVLLFYFLELESFIWLYKQLKNPIFIVCIYFNCRNKFPLQHKKNILKIDSIISLNNMYIFKNRKTYEI